MCKAQQSNMRDKLRASTDGLIRMVIEANDGYTITTKVRGNNKRNINCAGRYTKLEEQGTAWKVPKTITRSSR
uniref:Uncharacterized protein n=1 Tax=Vespula pensylvanica TaxID=30213 RepID=A0A834UCS8_VESPE|nr:hypothetical protein H0235_004236 [Vespula pensylvanica]